MNNTINNINTIEELKDYANSQYTVIVTQTKKISDLNTKLEDLEKKLKDVEKQELVTNTLSIDQEKNSDVETTCVVQIAMLKGLAMSRELTLEETKKLEIFAKTLQLMKGKNVEDKNRDKGAKLTTEQLLSLASNLSEQ